MQAYGGCFEDFSAGFLEACRRRGLDAEKTAAEADRLAGESQVVRRRLEKRAGMTSDAVGIGGSLLSLAGMGLALGAAGVLGGGYMAGRAIPALLDADHDEKSAIREAQLNELIAEYRRQSDLAIQSARAARIRNQRLSRRPNYGAYL